MKKILALLISLMMVFSLTACGGPSPTDVSDNFLTAIKNADNEALAECYVEDEFDLFQEASDAAESDDEEDGDKEEAEADDALTKVYEENLVPKMLEFEYELSNEKIDGDKATVDVTEKTYEKTATLSLIKKDDKWLVDSVEGNKDVLNALSGGLVDAVSNMATAFGE